MNTYINPIIKNAKTWIVAALILALSIIQVTAQETAQNNATLEPIIPTLEELGVDSTTIINKVEPTESTAFSTYLTEPPHQTNQFASQYNISSTTPFTPTGHFENTFLAPSDTIIIGANQNLFAYDSAYTSRPLYFSLNNGLSWRTSKIDNITSIAASPEDQNHLIIGTDYRGIYVSNDLGITWKNATSEKGSFKEIIFSPTYDKDNLIFARQLEHTVVLRGRFVKSSNGGQTWSTIPVPIEITDIAIAPNYSTSKTLLATSGKTVIFSADGGANWQTGAKGLDIEYDNIINEVIFSPNFGTDNKIYALTKYGLYESKNRGQSWSRILPYVISQITFHPNYQANKTFFMVATVQDNTNTQYDVLFRTKNGGSSFEGLVAYVRDFKLSPNYPENQTMYVHTDSGLGHSTDNGQSWHLLSQNTFDYSVNDIVVSPNLDNDNTIFLTNKGWTTANPYVMLWKSTTLGYTWEQLSLPNNESRNPLKIALSPNYKNDQTIILLQGSAPNAWGKLYKSTNGGESWQLLQNVLPLSGNRRPRLLLSPNYQQDKTIFISDDDGVFSSQDDGISWQKLNRGVYDIAIAPDYPIDNRIFISTGAGIARSNDGGLTWHPFVSPPGVGEWEIDLSPNFINDNTIVVSGYKVHTSTDAGDTWSGTYGDNNPHFSGNMSMSSNFDQDETIVVGVNSGLFMTENSGADWFSLKGMPRSTNLAITAAPNYRGRILPMSATNDGFFLYYWPTQYFAGYDCSPGLNLDATDPQYATLQVGTNSPYPIQWQVNTNGIDWLSLPSNSGSSPEMPQLVVDSSVVDNPVRDQVEVDIFLSHQQSVQVNANVFLPCATQSLPFISQE